MRTGQLSLMLGTLRDVFAEHPGGLQVDAELSRSIAAGLSDMERAAAALEQRSLELDELRLDCGISARLCKEEDGPDNVIAFPVIRRPIPAAAGDGGAA